MEIVLVGGGHTHVEVLRRFCEEPVRGAKLTLVAKEVLAPYSGMLPGWVAGRWPPRAGMIDLGPLAERAGARLLPQAAVALKPDERRIALADGTQLSFDLLSLDIGVVPDLDGIAGARDHGLAVKPISSFERRWKEVLSGSDLSQNEWGCVVIGGGAAGFELAHALRRRLDAMGSRHRGSVTLVAGNWLPDLPECGRRLARQSLDDCAIKLVTGRCAIAVDAAKVELDDGTRLPAGAVLLATGARAPEILKHSGLPVDKKGFVLVEKTLQVPGRPEIFAVGDCAHLLGQERPKAGVYAVRQGPVLAANLRSAAAGAPLRPYRAQRRRLQILSLADGTGIALWGPFALRGRWALRLKDRIDRSFVGRYDPEASGTPQSKGSRPYPPVS